MINILQLLRPLQWVKNGFIFLPLFFDRHLLQWDYWVPCLWAFFAFSFMASAIYCFNDIYDVEADRKHPKKCKRPIASGAISKRVGYVVMALCVCVSLILAYLGNFVVETGRQNLIIVLLSYFILNIAYCVKLKQWAIVDVFVIALGFVLRLVVGGVVTGIYLSQWIVLMTFLLALFLAFAKRRDDVVMYEETGVVAREHIVRYNIHFMNQAIGLIASITMVCYIMYTVSDEVVQRMHSEYLYVTSLFVLAGIIRYLQITIVDIKSGSPTKVLMKDHFIQACLAGWILTFIVILYL